MVSGREIKLAACCLLMVGCRQKMADQPNYHRPLEPSAAFADGRVARPLVEGAVARGQLRDDPHLDLGKVNGEFVETFPFEVTPEVLSRGRQRFDIYCSVCHDRVGTGDGRIVRRGFTRPPNLHTDLSRGFKLKGRDLSLRDAPVGYFFDVISNGFGAMPDYASQIPVRDRWAIVAHVRVLQLSQGAKVADLPAEERAKYFPPGGTR